MRLMCLPLLLFLLWPWQGWAYAQATSVERTQPIYRLTKSDIQKGFSLRGDVQWQAMPCSIDNFVIRKKIVRFPLYQYKGRVDRDSNDHEGYYCFHVEAPRTVKRSLLHVRLIRVFGQVELTINEQVVWQQAGDVGKVFEVLFQPTTEKLAIQMQMKCAESYICGFRGGFKFNHVSKGLSDELYSQTLDLFAFAGILFCGLFHLIFVTMRRRSEAAVALLLVAVALGMRILLTGQGQLHLYTRISESLFWRLEIGTLYLLLPATIAMVQGIFPRDVGARWTKSARYGSVAAALFLPFGGPDHYLYFLLIAYILIIMTLWTLMSTIVKAYRNKRTAILVFVLCSLTILTSTAMEVTNTRLNLELNPSFHPLGYLFSIVTMAVLLATRISEAFSRVEIQEREIKILTRRLQYEIDNLDRKIAERTSELASIIGALPTGIITLTRHESGDWVVSSQYSTFLRTTLGMDVQSFADLEYVFSKMQVAGPHFPLQSEQLEAQLHVASDDADVQAERIRRLFPSSVSYQMGKQHLEFKVHLSFVTHHEQIVGLFVFLVDVSTLHGLEAQSQSAEIAHTEALARVAAQADLFAEQPMIEFFQHPFWSQLGAARYRELCERLRQDISHPEAS
jgi:hypothetical protein